MKITEHLDNLLCADKRLPLWMYSLLSYEKIMEFDFNDGTKSYKKLIHIR